jgi:hypothetical protein
MKKITTILFIALFSACSQTPTPAPEAKTQPVPMSPEQMEEAWKKAATPRAEHRALDALVGKYKVETKMWMDPLMQPDVATGIAEYSWILDGHFLSLDYHGEFQGRRFDGQSLFGFNNMTGKYESTWVDSMSTQIMKSEGTADASGKVITFAGEFLCPIRQGPQKIREVMTIGTDKHTYEMFDRTPDGKEYKSLEITYTRDKKSCHCHGKSHWKKGCHGKKCGKRKK